MEIYINIFIGFCMFVIGTLFGSFFSLATYRLPRHQDIVFKRSYCPNCNHNLGFFDLIPVLSYLFCGGKCRYCKERISPRYIILEITNGVLFLSLYLIFGYTIKLMIICLLYAVVFVLMGSAIMKLKMSEEERIDVSKLTTKKGVYVAEIVVAMVLFTMLLTSSYVISKNYNSSSAVTIYKSNAVEIAVKTAEVLKATKYDYIESTNYIVSENNVSYTVDIEVIPFNQIDAKYENIAKKVIIKVMYSYESVPYEYTLFILKGKVEE